MNYKAVTFVSKPDDIPKEEHWAIIEGTSTLIPGDERSRNNPGHGYPETTEHHITYKAYLTEKDFKEALAEEMSAKYHSGTIRGIHVAGVYEAEQTWNISIKKIT